MTEKYPAIPEIAKAVNNNIIGKIICFFKMGSMRNLPRHHY
jgi:hypothetical protein